MDTAGTTEIREGLSHTQQEVISTILSHLEQTGWNRQRLQKEIESYADVLGKAFPSDADLFRLGRELEHLVRWTRLPGHCLAFVYQYLALQRRSASFVLAASLYADSQAVIGDDLAINSLENAWGVAQRSFPSETDLIDKLKFRLKLALDLCEENRRRFAFQDSNPLVQNLYYEFSQYWLREGDKSDGDHDYAEVVRHRFAGLMREPSGNFEGALTEYDAGLKAAKEAHLEPEIGHLLRHRGYALRCLGRYAESVLAFQAACDWEAEPVFGYWRALSQHELGLSLGFQARTSPDLLSKALDSFREGRKTLDLCLSVAMPEIRDVEQELARVFNENAINLTVALEQHRDTLAFTETSGPRQVTEAVAEVLPDWRPAGITLQDYQRARSSYYRQMNSYVRGIDHYLAQLPGNYILRKEYLRTRQSMVPQFFLAHNSDIAAQKLLQSQAQGCVFIFPHVGMKRSWVTAVDMETHRVKTLPSDEFTAHQAERAHEEFREGCLAESPVPGDDSPQRRAVDRLLGTYASWFGPMLQELLNGSNASHIKFFPHEDMNPVPLHALPWAEGRLLDHYTVSYGQTIALWLLGNERPAISPSECSLMVVDAGGLPFYSATLSRGQVLTQPSWQEFLAEVGQRVPTSLLFACHGEFDPFEPGESRLHFGVPEGISFYQFFGELNLEKCENVILGACESGLTRSRVGAEYCGLQMAFLSAGARNVVASQWQVNQLSTALLMKRLTENLASDNIPRALQKAQIAVRDMTAAQIADWLETELDKVDPEGAPFMASAIRKRGGKPFEEPYFWAGFTSMGGV